MENISVSLRPLATHDVAHEAARLLAFYNGLSPASIRMFRPLGWSTSLEVCERIAAENSLSPAPRVDIFALDGEEMVGWVFLSDLNTDHPELGLGVADRAQGQGIGKALMRAIFAEARGRALPLVYLIAVQDNQRALNLYQQFGFTVYAEMLDPADQLPYYKMVAHLVPDIEINRTSRVSTG